MKNNKIIKIIATILSALIVISTLPVAVFAGVRGITLTENKKTISNTSFDGVLTLRCSYEGEEIPKLEFTDCSFDYILIYSGGDWDLSFSGNTIISGSIEVRSEDGTDRRDTDDFLFIMGAPSGTEFNIIDVKVKAVPEYNEVREILEEDGEFFYTCNGVKAVAEDAPFSVECSYEIERYSEWNEEQGRDIEVKIINNTLNVFSAKEIYIANGVNSFDNLLVELNRDKNCVLDFNVNEQMRSGNLNVVAVVNADFGDEPVPNDFVPGELNITGNFASNNIIVSGRADISQLAFDGGDSNSITVSSIYSPDRESIIADTAVNIGTQFVSVDSENNMPIRIFADNGAYIQNLDGAELAVMVSQDNAEPIELSLKDAHIFGAGSVFIPGTTDYEYSLYKNGNSVEFEKEIIAAENKTHLNVSEENIISDFQYDDCNYCTSYVLEQSIGGVTLVEKIKHKSIIEASEDTEKYTGKYFSEDVVIYSVGEENGIQSSALFESCKFGENINIAVLSDYDGIHLEMNNTTVINEDGNKAIFTAGVVDTLGRYDGSVSVWGLPSQYDAISNCRSLWLGNAEPDAHFSINGIGFNAAATEENEPCDYNVGLERECFDMHYDYWPESHNDCPEDGDSFRVNVNGSIESIVAQGNTSLCEIRTEGIYGDLDVEFSEESSLLTDGLFSVINEYIDPAQNEGQEYPVNENSTICLNGILPPIGLMLKGRVDVTGLTGDPCEIQYYAGTGNSYPKLGNNNITVICDGDGEAKIDTAFGAYVSIPNSMLGKVTLNTYNSESELLPFMLGSAEICDNSVVIGSVNSNCVYRLYSSDGQTPLFDSTVAEEGSVVIIENSTKLLPDPEIFSSARSFRLEAEFNGVTASTVLYNGDYLIAEENTTEISDIVFSDDVNILAGGIPENGRDSSIRFTNCTFEEDVKVNVILENERIRVDFGEGNTVVDNNDTPSVFSINAENINGYENYNEVLVSNLPVNFKAQANNSRARFEFCGGTPEVYTVNGASVQADLPESYDPETGYYELAYGFFIEPVSYGEDDNGKMLGVYGDVTAVTVSSTPEAPSDITEISTQGLYADITINLDISEKTSEKGTFRLRNDYNMTEVFSRPVCEGAVAVLKGSLSVGSLELSGMIDISSEEFEYSSEEKIFIGSWCQNNCYNIGSKNVEVTGAGEYTVNIIAQNGAQIDVYASGVNIDVNREESNQISVRDVYVYDCETGFAVNSSYLDCTAELYINDELVSVQNESQTDVYTHLIPQGNYDTNLSNWLLKISNNGITVNYRLYHMFDVCKHNAYVIKSVDGFEAPDCINGGYAVFECNICGLKEFRWIEPLSENGEHSAYEVDEIPATCTEDGVEAGERCLVCGKDIIGFECIPALGHSVVNDDYVAPTCTEIGKTSGAHCSACDVVILAQKDINALGHKTVTDKGYAATCTVDGLTDGSHCAVCGTVFTAQQTITALGHTVVNDDYVAPTCTEKGKTAGTHCSRCGEILIAQTDIPALGHTVVNDDYVAPTCTEKGKTAGTHCSKCGEILVAQTDIPALGHTVVNDDYVAPTCTESGKTSGAHCSVCDVVILAQKDINSLGHKTVTDKGYAATCTENGLTDGSHCAVCGTVFTAQQTITALGHVTANDAEVKATCTEKGKTAGTHCSRCGEILVAQTDIPALNHTVVNDDYVAPTCTESGKTSGAHCSACDVVILAQKNINAIGHKTVTDKGYAATCTVNGLTDGSHCAICDIVLTAQQPITALGHTVVNDDYVAPTCTEKGKTAGTHCSRCGEILVAQTDIPALNHTVVNDDYVAPTCTESGKTSGAHCSACDEVILAQKDINALGHKTVTDKGYAATCTENGLTDGSHCAVCGTVLTAQQTITALGHVTANDAEVKATCTEKGKTAGTHCSRCGEILVAQTDIPALGHTVVNDDYVAPTCTESGKTSGAHCSACDEVILAQKDINALGHKTVTDKGYAATCTVDGLTDGSHCAICDIVLTAQQPIIARGTHSHIVTDTGYAPTAVRTGLTNGSHCTECGEIVVEQLVILELNHAPVLDPLVAATCIETGLTKAEICTDCGETVAKQKVIPATGQHIYSEFVKTVAPTCISQGYTVYKCKTCSKTENRNYVAVSAHLWGAWTVVTAATTEKAGSEKRICSVCKKVETRVIDKLTPQKLDIVNTSEIKTAKSGSVLFVLTDVTAKMLQSNATAGAVLYKKDGKIKVDLSESLGTGMLLVLKNGDKTVDSIRIVVQGDIDGDKTITAADARTALRAAVGLETLNDWEGLAAKVDADKKVPVSASDARLILRAAVGLEDTKDWLKTAE